MWKEEAHFWYQILLLERVPPLAMATAAFHNGFQVRFTLIFSLKKRLSSVFLSHFSPRMENQQRHLKRHHSKLPISITGNNDFFPFEKNWLERFFFKCLLIAHYCRKVFIERKKKKFSLTLSIINAACAQLLHTCGKCLGEILNTIFSRSRWRWVATLQVIKLRTRTSRKHTFVPLIFITMVQPPPPKHPGSDVI